MENKKSIGLQCRECLPLLLGVYLAAAALFVVVISFGLRNNLPPQYFTRDPASVMKGEWYTGFFSNLGVLFWCATSAVCLFSFSILQRERSEKKWASFFLISGLFTLLLLFDDFFLFHDRIMHNLFPFSLPDWPLFILYGVLALLFLFRFKDKILESDYLILTLAVGLLAISVGLDKWPFHFPHQMFVEDVPKFFGILGWFLYFTKTCFRVIKNNKNIAIK